MILDNKVALVPKKVSFRNQYQKPNIFKVLVSKKRTIPYPSHKCHKVVTQISKLVIRGICESEYYYLKSSNV